MTKRTNKTDHVLSLLGGAGKKQDDEDKAVDKNKSQPPVDPLNQQKGSVSVMYASTSEEDPIAGSIRDTLEKELQESQLLKEQNSEAELEFAKELEISLQEEPELESVMLFQDEPEVEPEMLLQGELEVEPVMSLQEEPEVEPVMSLQEEQKEEAEPEMLQQEKPAESEQKEAVQERDFEFVNVMERLVRDKVLGYMQQFGNCTCERCVEDTVALTLTNLPAKCVVVNKTSVSPLLNFYTQKYAGHITVEITKACIVVNNNPCH